MADERQSIEKLNGDNFATWKFQMKHVLISKGCWNSRTSKPINLNTDSKKAEQAFTQIVLSVSTNLLYLITDCECPDEAWTKLQKHFEQNTIANKLFLKKKFFRLVMKEEATVTEHLKNMKELTDKLKALKSPIDEEDQVVTLLGSLPTRFNTLVTALEARADNLSLEFVHQSLINEEQKQTEKNSEQSAADVEGAAFYGNANRRGHGQNMRVRSIVCFECGREGHFKRECPRLNQYGKRKNVTNNVGHNAEASFMVTDDDIPSWIIDSGASKHMSGYRDLFENYEVLNNGETVQVGDGHSVKAVGVGSVRLQIIVSGEIKTITMSDVLHVPDLASNLFSVSAAARKGYVVQFGNNLCWIKDKGKVVRAVGKLEGKLYKLQCVSASGMNDKCYSASSDSGTWHRRLGHVCDQTLKTLSNKVDGIKNLSGQMQFCEDCVRGKLTSKTFPKEATRAKRLLELVHSDVCGKFDVESCGGACYFVTFIDDFSRYTRVYFIKNKSEVFEKFKEFKAQAEKETGYSISRLRSDRGGEYMSTEFQSFLKTHGIGHELTVAHTPQQNGVSERMNRTLVESARCMMLHANVPSKLWAEAISTASHVRNRLPSTSIHGDTPYSIWNGRKPNVAYMRVFGCVAYAQIPQRYRRKFDSKAKKLRFVGYSIHSKGYRLMDDTTGEVSVHRNVEFNETNFGNNGRNYPIVSYSDELVCDLGDTSENTEYNDETTNEDSVVEPETETQLTDGRPVRERRKPVWLRDYEENYNGGDEVHEAYKAVVNEPTTLQDAIDSPLSNEWLQAAREEYDSLLKNETWDLVDLPEGKKTVGTKWVFKSKLDASGNVKRFKARLVAKGYSQKHGIDYHDTYAPVVSLKSLRLLLVFGIKHDYKIHQMDVITAFLYGTLEEDIYVNQPEGFEVKGMENKVCKLKKSLYGLKQSPRCWNQVLHEYLLSREFNQTISEPCIYCHLQKSSGNLPVTIIAVYVDDLVILALTDEFMNTVKKMLCERFEMKDLGRIDYCLGLVIVQKSDSIMIHQQPYIRQLLEKYKMTDAKPAQTPFDINVKLTKDDGISKAVSTTEYQGIVGSLLYLAMGTRPDIAQIVGELSKFNSCPNQSHLTVAKRVLRYLKETSELGLVYKSDLQNVVGYSDADWAGSLDDRHSTSGYVFMFGGGAITWKSKRQSTVATSTAEAEYMALYMAIQEAIWIRQLLGELTGKSDVIDVWVDNQAAIAIANGTRSRLKHIDIKYHFIREAVANKQVATPYCPSNDNIADMLTKSTPLSKFQQGRILVGLQQN